MLALEILGLVWLVAMMVRAHSLWYEVSMLYTLFRKKYTRLQSGYVMFRWVLVPGLLIAPAVLWLEGRAALRVPSMAEMFDIAIALDQNLQARAAKQEPAQ